MFWKKIQFAVNFITIDLNGFFNRIFSSVLTFFIENLYSWQALNSNDDKPHKKKSYLKIIISIVGWFILFGFFLLSFDLFLFYKINKDFFVQEVKSIELDFNELSKGFSDWNVNNINWSINSIKFKKEEIADRFEIYKEKISFKVFWINYFIDFILGYSEYLTSLPEEVLEIYKNYNDIFIQRWFWNPSQELWKNLRDLEIKINILNSKIEFLNFWFLPDDIKNNIENLSIISKIFDNILLDLNKNFSLISKILWTNEPQTTAILFQNSNELRPTGWFIGSFMVLKTNNGRVVNYSLHDIYQFDWQIGNDIIPPYEWERLSWTKNWSLRDANINPDLEISARNFNSFFEKAWWSTIDNFIFIDEVVISDLLRIIWPVKLKSFWTEIDSENFDFVMQFFIEWKRASFVSPKYILLNDFFNEFKSKFSIWSVLSDNLLSWNIQENISPELGFDKQLEEMLLISDKVKSTYFLKDSLISAKHLQFVSLNNDITLELNKLNATNWLPERDFIIPVLISISWNKSDKFVSTNLSVKKDSNFEFVFNLKRNFKWPLSYEKKLNELYLKYWSWIPKDILKNILWYWWNRSILQIYTESNYDLLFAKNKSWTWESIKEDKVDFRKWQKWNFNIFEFELPLIDANNGSLDINFYFKSNNKIWNIEIWQQPWIKNLIIK